MLKGNGIKAGMEKDRFFCFIIIFRKSGLRYYTPRARAIIENNLLTLFASHAGGRIILGAGTVKIISLKEMQADYTPFNIIRSVVISSYYYLLLCLPPFVPLFLFST